ncbi:MAG: hypothetical protein H5U15_11850 [Roseovarius sp.]|nr:hypothetical protein [Roseovarius sp.]
MVSAVVKTVFAETDRDRVHARWRGIVESLALKLHGTNPLERVNKEIRRRTFEAFAYRCEMAALSAYRPLAAFAAKRCYGIGHMAEAMLLTRRVDLPGAFRQGDGGA